MNDDFKIIQRRFEVLSKKKQESKELLIRIDEEKKRLFKEREEILSQLNGVSPSNVPKLIEKLEKEINKLLEEAEKIVQEIENGE